MIDPLIGQHLGNYRVDSVVGRGGMAAVYYGWDVRLHRPVALKVIDASHRSDPAYAERFLQEARVVATWRHDNILQVYYAGQQDDLYYFAMEFVDGADLSQLLRQCSDEGELLPYKEVLEVGRAVAKALDFAHSQGIVHRDVKPSNVMVAKDNRVALADFGLALNAQQGSFGGTFGTPQYIAPEQARNSAMAVPQSDLYALGVILYEMLTGSVPFDDPSPTSLALQHLTQPPPPPRQLNPNLSAATEQVLLKALNKLPDERYETGAALMDALTTTLNGSEAADEAMALPSSYEAPLPLPPSTAATGRTFPAVRLLWAGVAILLFVGWGWALFLRNGGTETAVLLSDTSPTASTTAEEQAIMVITMPSETAPSFQASAAETAEPLTPSAEPITPSPEPLQIAGPTDTPAPQPTNSPTEAPVAVPTATPSGPRLEMLYDSTSFYLYNSNANRDVLLSQLLFESLDDHGNLSGYWFEGRRWSQFYSFVEPFGCARLEITKASGWLRPSQCRRFNATITPEQDSSMVFWTSRPGVAAFRVLWQGQEVSRCDVVAGQCEAYLP